jgi:uncharacterized protein YacL
MVRKIMRVVIAFVFLALGIYIGYLLTHSGFLPAPNFLVELSFIIIPGVLTGLIGFLAAPRLISWIVRSMKWVEGKLQKMPLTDLAGGAIGLIIGLIIASLLGSTFAKVPLIGNYAPLIGSALFGYLGLSIGLKKTDELLAVFPKLGKEREKDKEKDREKGEKIALPKNEARQAVKILDTSVIIDGRIADICKSGFLDGTLVIPSFVLEELRHIADSSDLLKRNRGRRGLDILNRIRKDMDVKVQISEQDFPDIAEVDSKLVRLGQLLGGEILTNDYNLNKVAEFQGVKVLNINELANALKPVFLPGEEMLVQIVKDGKESRQGIGYLDDGTMIVVETGKRYINQTIYVVVTSVLQTAAGRMIFAKPKFPDNRTVVEEDAIG